MGRRERYSVWERWHDPPTDSTHLKVLARQVIGLMEVVDGMDCAKIAKLLQQPEKKIDCILKEIRKSRHPVIKMLRTHGLPMFAAVRLPTDVTVRCKVCHNKLCEVPCISCKIKVTTPLQKVVNGHGFRDIGQGTAYPPGSWGKIEVMRDRLARGYSAFSKKDVQ